jgi:predicted RNase H-like HicB family nuclease
MPRVRVLSISRYVQAALERAEYKSDENGVIIACVPGAAGFFSQGDSFEEARENLRDAIEGNLTLALQLGLPIPAFEGVPVEEQDVPAYAT